METQRLFISIPLTEVFRLSLLDIRPDTARWPQIRWVAAETLHITLHFLGDTPVEQIPDLIKRLKEVATNFSPFELTFQQTELVWRQRKPALIWSRMAAHPTFTQLAKGVIRAVNGKADYPPLPHITVARIRNLNFLDERDLNFISPTITQLPVEHFELIQSELLPQGPRYTVVEAFLLDKK